MPASPPTIAHRELFILVIGETARADRFSLNGYERDTNPRLRAANAINFTNFWACGTSTAISVPCIFSFLGADKFDTKTAAAQENLLDVLQRAGASVLWLDNNSDSKDVALRVPYQSYKSPAVNPLCNPECRDVGMLSALQQHIDAHPKGDIFIVLHQMGNHGPAYYKRYPPEFEKFKPACQSADLSQCSREEIGNAYDNAILYTDFFLGEVIALLKKNDDKFETGMLYVSDHGESLGENGVYLHGLPNAIAPDAQLHVPAVMWLGRGFRDEVDIPALMQKRGTRYTHDNIVPHDSRLPGNPEYRSIDRNWTCSTEHGSRSTRFAPSVSIERMNLLNSQPNPAVASPTGAPTLRLDLVAGLTAAAVVLPKAMAYATVAGLPVAVGLYTALIPMAIYALLGSSRVLSVSSTTTLAILAGTQLGLAVPDGDPARLITAAATLTALVGVILVLAAVLRLGFVANFISTPVLTGFKAGIGLVIVLDQVPKLLGLHITKEGFFRDVLSLVQHLPDTSLLTLAVAAATLDRAARHGTAVAAFAGAAGRGGRRHRRLLAFRPRMPRAFPPSA